MDNYDNWLKTVVFDRSTNAGGDIFAPVFYDILKDTKVDTIYEWCSGPAVIGIYLLENNICDHLVLSDINPRAIQQAQTTLYSKNLLDKASLYVSDNLKDVPLQTFDIVVGNPPHYYNINQDHPLGPINDNILMTDTNWDVHREFFNNISDYLTPSSKMYIGEAGLNSDKIYIRDKDVPWDVRNRKPIDVFFNLIVDNKMKLNKISKMKVKDADKYKVYDSNKNILKYMDIMEISLA